MTRPIDDPRPFADVLRDWMARRDLTAYAAAPILEVTRMTIGNWLQGAKSPHERAYRALLTVLDDGQA